MYIESLKLTSFRNFSSFILKPDKGINILYGSNGSGKTNILESIFLLCLGRSQRGAHDSAMSTNGEDVYRVEGTIGLDDSLHTCSVACQRGSSKKITIDGATAKTSELFNRHSVVSIGPEDYLIISGAPSMRRTFLDTYISQFSREYLSRLIDYQRTLAQKNAALKSEQDPSPFNSLLVPLGADITLSRSHFVQFLSEKSAHYYKSISDGGLLELGYHSSVCPGTQPDEIDSILSSFESRLYDFSEREKIMKTAMIGPHRDDLQVKISGYQARTHASRGEIRTASIALKLAVYHLLRQERKRTPVLLLDEIFSELDKNRSEALIESFSDFGQLFLTSAVDPIETMQGRGTALRLHSGELKRKR
ncbi:MAG: DNA replication and repair protein RecF [candidate division Zixibacteria bacterium]|nr:DNA replication and repair protein RecF [candidate division Zixibacteria bacterium]